MEEHHDHEAERQKAEREGRKLVCPECPECPPGVLAVIFVDGPLAGELKATVPFAEGARPPDWGLIAKTHARATATDTAGALLRFGTDIYRVTRLRQTYCSEWTADGPTETDASTSIELTVADEDSIGEDELIQQMPDRDEGRE